jgi:3-dehydroquinate synthetase
MEVYRQIIRESRPIDNKFKNIDERHIDSVQIVYVVPNFHPRIKQIKNYIFRPLLLEKLIKDRIYNLAPNHTYIIDKSISQQDFIKKFLKKNKIKPIVLKAIEDTVKTKAFLDEILRENQLEEKQNLTFIVIGGGLLMNVGAYIAERTSGNLILFPTTVLSMADSSGGKVRINFVASNRAYKHFYKSFYEPNAMFLDERFLASLPIKQIQIGLVEIIKHSLFQSPALYDFLFLSG